MMWRSFVSRSQPILSNLRRPTRCSHADTAVAAALASADRARAYAASNSPLEPEVDREESWPRPRRHLYVVLDEMNTGQSIYKLNIDDLDSGDEEAVAEMKNMAPRKTRSQPLRLPDPVLRLGIQSVGLHPYFEALESKIVVTGNLKGGHRITLVYDTKTARLDIGQRPPRGLRHCRYYNAAGVGNRLYMFGTDGQTPQYLCEQHALPDHCDGDDSGDEMMLHTMKGQIKEWAWKKAGSPLPRAADVDGGNRYVNSYAVHPDGHTILVSCSSTYNMEPRHHPFTFSIDTEDGQSVCRGEWSLPFNKRAYYDPDLEAWVGIRMADGPDGRGWKYPYLCSCDVPDLGGDKDLVRAPAWKLCNEQLTFVETPTDLYSRALVHTGRGRFCLIEIVPTSEAKGRVARRRNREGLECLLHVTMFRAKHGKNGELLVAPCRPGRSFLVPNYSSGLPSAFWI